MEARPFGSRYLLGEVIGRGAMGRVYRAQVRSGGPDVAVKLLRDDLTTQPEVVGRFVQERDLLRAVAHPNVVAVRDLVVEGDELGIVMDLVAAGHLRRAVPPPVAPQTAVQLITQVADGLAAVHAAGVVHRDLKPENILVETLPSGERWLRLTDFGISRLIGNSSTNLTSVIGTPGYLAPEVAMGVKASRASDVYALGVMLYEWCTGRPPFRAENAHALMRMHAEDPVPLPEGMPKVLRDLFAAMLAKDAASRPDAQQVAERLRAMAPELVGLEPFVIGEAMLTLIPGTRSIPALADDAVTQARVPAVAEFDPQPQTVLGAVPAFAPAAPGFAPGPQVYEPVPPPGSNRSNRSRPVLLAGVGLVVVAAVVATLAFFRSGTGGVAAAASNTPSATATASGPAASGSVSGPAAASAGATGGALTQPTQAGQAQGKGQLNGGQLNGGQLNGGQVAGGQVGGGQVGGSKGTLGTSRPTVVGGTGTGGTGTGGTGPSSGSSGGSAGGSTPVPPPGTVPVMSLSGATQATMEVSWGAAPGATGYTIGWVESGSDGRVWTSGRGGYDLTSSPLQLINLKPGRTYTVSVTAVNADAAGAPVTRTGNTLAAPPSSPPPAVPGAVGSMSLSGATQTTMQVSWSVASGATGYTVGWTESGSDGRVWTSGRGGYHLAGSPLTLISLKPGRTYTVSVTGVNATGDGPPVTRTLSTPA